MALGPVRQHASGAAIAFNNSPEDTADAALRWLPTEVKEGHGR
ncbi:hypothetical protein [Micromonospora parastrephiae]|nr:hypothetical protein [Micromonospora parastrephiae]